MIKKCPNFYDIAGTGAGEATVEELKKELDEMREEDNDRYRRLCNTPVKSLQK